MPPPLQPHSGRRQPAQWPGRRPVALQEADGRTDQRGGAPVGARRELRGGLHLVATTALGDPESRAKTALAGFHEHLVKPVDSQTLIEALTHLGKFVAKHNPDAPPGSLG